MAVEPEIPFTPTPGRRWIFLFAAGMVLIFLCLHVPQLLTRFYYQQSLKSLNKDELEETRLCLEAARSWLGLLVFDNDRKRIAVVEGELHIRRAETAKTLPAFVEAMEKAEVQFREVIAIEPYELDGYIGLVRAATALEKVYPFVKKNPYHTRVLTLFERLRVLMPANLYTYTLLTQYYYSHKMTDELIASIGQAITLFPPLYFQLKQQPFYSLAMNEMLKKSLQSAISQDVFREGAYKALADLAQQEEDYKSAIGYLLLAKPTFQYRDNSGYHMELAGLYLKAGQLPEAEMAFLEALKTPNRERHLNEIWLKYKDKKQYHDFLNFCHHIKEKSVADHLEVLQAKCLMELGQPELAISHLIRVSSSKYAAESQYLQGRIAENQKDWDTMELRSQRATVLDAKKTEYHILFSRALQNQQKWPQAEQAATDAIRHAGSENPWLYNHRAWIRSNRKDYEGARQDWQKAIAIAPNTAGFYSSVAMTFELGGNARDAIIYIKKAIALNPGEQNYQKKLDNLENPPLHKK